LCIELTAIYSPSDQSHNAVCRLRPNVTSSIKLEVHNVVQCHQRITEPRPQGMCTKNVVRIGPAVPEICLRTDRQTDRWVDHNTPHLVVWRIVINPSGRSKKQCRNGKTTMPTMHLELNDYQINEQQLLMYYANLLVNSI